MQKNFNFKIVGSGPTGLLLAIALSRLNLNIFLTDLLNRNSLINKDKTYAITHSTRIILKKFNLWTKLKPYLYGFNTLSISDSTTSSFTLLSIADLDKDIRVSNNIGWVVKHSDLMNVFFKEIDKQKNIFFKSPKKLSKEIGLFDYEFISTGARNLSDKRIPNLLEIRKSYNQACLTFKVLVRGNLENRAYEIFRKEGPLALLPLEKNLYQIIWTSSTTKSMERLNTDRNILMDNLDAILPNYFKLDQMVGEVNVFPVSLSLNCKIFNSRKMVYVGDSFHTFHPVGGQGLNTCWRDVNSIYDIFNKSNFVSKKDLELFKFKYLLRRSLDILVTVIITDSLINLFSNKNLILVPFKKTSFYFLNKSKLVRKIILNQMTKSLIFSNIK